MTIEFRNSDEKKLWREVVARAGCGWHANVEAADQAVLAYRKRAFSPRPSKIDLIREARQTASRLCVGSEYTVLDPGPDWTLPSPAPSSAFRGARALVTAIDGDGVVQIVVLGQLGSTVVHPSWLSKAKLTKASVPSSED